LNQYADLRVNDLVTERCWVDEVSEPKETALGNGQFVTIAFSMVNQTGHEVGSVRARTFYYRPHAATDPRHPGRPVDPQAIEMLETPESVGVTRTLVIAGALASNDHEPVHHDHATALAQGLPDIIVSIVTTAGLVCAYGHRHWGIEHPKSLQLRLAAPTFPGDVLTFSGQAEPEAIVPQTIRVRATHERGTHCTAVVAPQPASHRK
jgi:acyl dehydratase